LSFFRQFWAEPFRSQLLLGMLFLRSVVLLQHKFYHILVLVTDESLNGVSCFAGASWNTTRSEGDSETERWASWYCFWRSLVCDHLFTIINLFVILLTGIKTKKYNSLGNQYVHFNVSIPVWVLDFISLFYVVYTTRKTVFIEARKPFEPTKICWKIVPSDRKELIENHFWRKSAWEITSNGKDWSKTFC